MNGSALAMITESFRSGLVTAEALARANILNTAMVQAQGLTASIDTLFSWTIAAENNIKSMKPISLNAENLDDQVSEFKVGGLLCI